MIKEAFLKSNQLQIVGNSISRQQVVENTSSIGNSCVIDLIPSLLKDKSVKPEDKVESTTSLHQLSSKIVSVRGSERFSRRKGGKPKCPNCRRSLRANHQCRTTALEASFSRHIFLRKVA